MGRYSSEFNTATQAFVYTQVYGGTDNYTWYTDLLSGDATFKGHMEPF